MTPVPPEGIPDLRNAVITDSFIVKVVSRGWATERQHVMDAIIDARMWMFFMILAGLTLS